MRLDGADGIRHLPRKRGSFGAHPFKGLTCKRQVVIGMACQVRGSREIAIDLDFHTRELFART